MKPKRKRLFSINRYQLRVLALVLAPPVLIVAVLTWLSAAFFEQLIATVENGSGASLLTLVGQWKYQFILGLWATLTLIVLMTYMVSKNLLGAFGRIFRELDEVIEGKRDAPLTARPKDQLANELLQRINTLTERNAKGAETP